MCVCVRVCVLQFRRYKATFNCYFLRNFHFALYYE